MLTFLRAHALLPKHLSACSAVPSSPRLLRRAASQQRPGWKESNVAAPAGRAFCASSSSASSSSGGDSSSDLLVRGNTRLFVCPFVRWSAFLRAHVADAFLRFFHFFPQLIPGVSPRNKMLLLANGLGSLSDLQSVSEAFAPEPLLRALV